MNRLLKNGLRASTWVVVWMALTSPVMAQPVNPDLTLSLTDATGPVGTQVMTTALFDNVGPEEIAGWTIGVCHNPALVSIVGAGSGTTVMTINNGGPPDFNQLNVVPVGSPSIGAGQTPGVNQAVVIAFLGGVTLSPGTGYEFLEIVYELADVGTSTIEYCSTTPGGAFSVDTVLSFAGGTSVLAIEQSATLEATTSPDYLLYFQELPVPSTNVGLACRLDSQPGTGDLFGWSFGVCHDTALVDPVAAQEGATVLTVNGGAAPDFSQVNIIPNATLLPPGSTPGVNAAVVINFLAAQSLPPGLGYELLDVEYAPVGLGLASFNYCDTTPGGAFDVETVLSVATGISVVPDLDPIAFMVGAPEIFERGDCNADGVMDLADAVFSLEFQFTDGPDASCLDACDLNDDGVLNVADPTYQILALFAGGPMPSAPFGACGEDPTADGLDCASFATCP